MARAIALSLENVRSGRGGPFAAVVVKDGKIIAEGVNRVTSTNDPTAHAEMMAIREACKKLQNFELTDCEIYTQLRAVPDVPGRDLLGAAGARLFREYRGGRGAGRIRRFVYLRGNRACRMRRRKIPMIQLMREEALEAFHAWREKPTRSAIEAG